VRWSEYGCDISVRNKILPSALPLKIGHTQTLTFDEALVVEGSFNISTADADHSIAHRLLRPRKARRLEQQYISRAQLADTL
jgi:hypothetical protein